MIQINGDIYQLIAPDRAYLAPSLPMVAWNDLGPVVASKIEWSLASGVDSGVVAGIHWERIL